MADESASWVSLSEMVWQHPAKIKMHSCFEGNLSATKYSTGTSLAVQRLRLHTSKAGGAGLIPGQGTKIPHATWRGQKKKKKERRQQKMMLARMWRKGNPCKCKLVQPLWKTVWRFLKKIKSRATIQSSNFTSW